jgi:hypothetical protein
MRLFGARAGSKTTQQGYRGGRAFKSIKSITFAPSFNFKVGNTARSRV